LALKPFITDITIIIAATPNAIPIIENQENIDTYPSDFFENKKRFVIKISDLESIKF
jgi:hypothetical protein